MLSMRSHRAFVQVARKQLSQHRSVPSSSLWFHSRISSSLAAHDPTQRDGRTQTSTRKPDQLYKQPVKSESTAAESSSDDVAVGPYMEHPSLHTAPPPPPPASPLADSYSHAGISTRKFAASHITQAFDGTHVTESQAELLNIVRGEDPLENVSPFETANADSTQQRRNRGETCSSVRNRTSASAGKLSSSSNRTKMYKGTFNNVAGSGSSRAFSTATVHPTITPNTPSSVIRESVASFQPGQNQPLDFVPTQPHTDANESQQQQQQSTANQTQSTQYQQQQQAQYEHHSSFDAEPAGHSTAASSASKNPFANFPTPPFLPNLSQLPQAFAMFEKLPDILPGALGEVAKKTLPNPAKILASFIPAAAGGSGGAGAGNNDGGNANSSSSSSSSFQSAGCRSKKPTKKQLLAEMLRVDHAGEYGAQRIYDGQLDVLRMLGKHHSNGLLSRAEALQNEKKRTQSQTPSAADVNAGAAAGSETSKQDRVDSVHMIEEMRQQEVEHLRTLEKLLPAHQVRPTALLPVWHVAGYALGAASALLGEKAAMACTVAVEEVITSHYNDQLRTLSTTGFEEFKDLKSTIKKHRDDEEQHRDIALEYDAKEAVAYEAMTNVIQTGCHAAIWISKRV